MRVNEIFYSLQGEGHYTGTPAVFLRLSGCNARCPFCDTRHESHIEMTEEEIVCQVLQLFGQPMPGQQPHVVITGGEPALQLTDTLIEKLHNAGCFVQIETNGSLPVPDSIDWITCSPKTLPLRIQRIDELKVLFDGCGMQNAERRIEEAGYDIKEFRLQPLDSGDAEKNRRNTRQTIEYILKHPKWKLSLQTHKILDIQ